VKSIRASPRFAPRCQSTSRGTSRGFKIWSRAQADIDRVCTIWRECLAKSGGPFLFGERSMADAMYAPVVTRFMTMTSSWSRG